VSDEVETKPAARIDDPSVRDELDEICGLVLVELVGCDQLDPTAAPITRSKSVAEN
jgi:hypothetical protein